MVGRDESPRIGESCMTIMLMSLCMWRGERIRARMLLELLDAMVRIILMRMEGGIIMMVEERRCMDHVKDDV